MTGNIIVVDDDQTSLKLLNNILSACNYSIRLFVSGDLALRSIHTAKPDLILLDIRMPNMNGLELCQKLKRDEQLKDIPVIFLSAATDIADKIKAFQAGGVDYITKPFQTEEILARVATHLKLHSALNELQTISTELRNSEARYRSVLEDQTEIISRLLPDGTFLFVNEVYCRLFGKSANELIGQRWQPVAHPDDVPMIEARLREMSPDNTVVTIENRVRLGNGDIHWMQFVNRGFYDTDGTLKEIQSVGRDITKLKETELNLRESDEALQRAQSVARIGSFTLDNNTETSRISKETARLFDLGDKGVTSFAEWFARVHPDDQAAVETAWRNALKGKPYFDMTYRIVVHGQTSWIRALVELRFDNQGQLAQATGTVQDISDLKQIESNLRESDERLEMALAGSSLVLWDWNIPERKVTVGNRWHELLGYSQDELGNDEDDWMNLIHPNDLESFNKKLSSHLQGETACFESEHRLRHKDGHWVAVEARGKVTLRGKSNAPLRMVGTILDVTQRKRLNEDGISLLKQIEALIRENSSPSPVKPVLSNAAEALTKRQRQILGLIAIGMTSAEIGKQLHLSTPTVISHRRNLMSKLDLHSTAEVTRFAIDHGLLATK